MKLIRNIFSISFFILLLSITVSFGASQTKTVTKADASTLYQPFQDPGLSYVKVTPGFSFKYQSTITTPTVIQAGSGGGLDGAVVCPGTTIDLSSTATATWASPNFYAYDLFWSTCQPPSSSDAPTNVGVSWSKNNYDALKDWNLCYDNNPQCWGKEGSFTSHKIDTYDYSGTLYSNRQGSVATTCWGTNTFSVSNGNFPGEGTKDTISSGTITRPSVTLSNAGVYTFTDKFDVKGCAVTIRQPKCGSANQAEDIYSRTVASLNPGASELSSSVGSNTFTITVSSVTAQISCGPLKDIVGPIDIPSVGKVVAVNIPNTGTVPVRVTGVTSSIPGQIQAAPFNVALCGSGAFPPSLLPCVAGANGFNLDIQPGLTGIVYVYLSSAPGIPAGTYNPNLLFSYEAGQSSCGTSGGAPPTCSLPITVNAGPSATNCTITPNPADVPYHQESDFKITCTDITGAPTSCGTPTWTLNGIDGIVSNQSGTGAIVWPDSSVGTKGTLDAVISPTVSCRANLTVTNPINPFDILPHSATMVVGDNQNFTGVCTASGSPIPCPSVQWNPSGYPIAIGTVNPTSGINTTFTATQITSTRLFACANFVPNRQCDYSDITVGASLATNCTISPNPADIGYYQISNFALACTDIAGAPTSCGAPTWALSGIDGFVFGTSGTGASVLPISSVGTKGTLTAAISSTLSCSSNLTVVPPINNNTLAVNPPSANLNVGQNQSFGAICTSLSGPIVCPNTAWNPFGLPPAIGTVNPTTGTNTTFTATQNTTTQLWACANGLTPVPCGKADIKVGSGICIGPNCGPGPDPGGDSCDLTPIGKAIVGRPVTFYISCPGGSCGKVNWKITEGIGKIQYNTSSYATVLFSSIGTVTAFVDDGFCPGEVEEGSYQCVQYT